MEHPLSPPPPPKGGITMAVHRRRRGGPPPDQSDQRGKNETYKRENIVGPFWVPNPPVSPLLLLPWPHRRPTYASPPPPTPFSRSPQMNFRRSHKNTKDIAHRLYHCWCSTSIFMEHPNCRGRFATPWGPVPVVAPPASTGRLRVHSNTGGCGFCKDHDGMSAPGAQRACSATICPSVTKDLWDKAVMWLPTTSQGW